MPQSVLRIGLYGANGHQIQHALAQTDGAVLAAACAMPGVELPPQVRRYEAYNELLADPQLDLISICAPLRSQQADAIRLALRAGKHVYAEKPCVLNEDELDEVLEIARQSGRELFEMAGTAFEEPYATAGELVASGVLGTIVQVTVQKSYPYADWRPQNEDIDGGLIMQNGIHAVRMIEHVAGQRVQAVSAISSGLGNPQAGGLQMAASAAFQLEGGALGSAIFNYLNQPGHGVWGNETLRIFGTRAFLETDIKNSRVRLVDAQMETLFAAKERTGYLQRVSHYLLGRAARPFSSEVEVHPTRVVIAARRSAMRAGEWMKLAK